MSLSGLRKQFNKANQYLSETMGAAEATKFDDQYNNMEKHIDLTYELISALVAGTNEYLQPNPGNDSRQNGNNGCYFKVRGTVKTAPYPQTEGMLSEIMNKFGTALGDSSDLGKALLDAAEAYRHMADIKYQMEENVKQNFIDPLTHLQINELKDVNHHRTKLKGRRLDYDCKKRQQRRDEELIQAEEKLEESKRLAEMAMFNVLSNDIEQVSQLRALVDAQLDFHRQTTQVLEGLQAQLAVRVKEASCRPRVEHHPLPVLSDRTPRSRSPITDGMMGADQSHGGFQQPQYSNGGSSQTSSSIPSSNMSQTQQQKPSAKAMFDFEAQNEGELNLKEGQVVELISQVDENWFEGRLNGKCGLFPIAYVQVLIPLR
ncbi:BAR domain protein [Dictyocaulus viviparus]|uniref:BAR domain protein n=1 Tax=Dictyocaulus viviparus TaxID=29172 RepID=A0A0D8XFQ0_DICVI|nr:BAR domain protein [Dictyocaulus viviparus]